MDQFKQEIAELKQLKNNYENGSVSKEQVKSQIETYKKRLHDIALKIVSCEWN